MTLALRGLEPKTTDPYLAGWRLRVVPALGHLPVTMVTNGAVDRTAYAWIADGEGRSTVKNTLAVLVRVMEQAVRDGLITANPARLKGWQRQYQLAEDELDDPRSLALRNWAPCRNSPPPWSPAPTSSTPAGETSSSSPPAPPPASAKSPAYGSRTSTWPTGSGPCAARPPPPPAGSPTRTPKARSPAASPSSKRYAPWSPNACSSCGSKPDARLFTGPRGGRITTAVLRDATHWDEVVHALGYEHLRRHDLRHTGLTWMADAGVPLHVLRLIAGHGSLQTTQRYLHPDLQSVLRAGRTLSNHLTATPRPSAALPHPVSDPAQIVGNRQSPSPT